MDDQPNVIESPVALLPDLTTWGLEEVDRGVVEDTAENRRTIRDNKARYQPVFTADGKPTNLIQVITAEMRSAALSASKNILLTDDRDVDSDYLSGIMLVIEPAADHIVPAWVLASTRYWLNVAEKRKETPNFRPSLIGPPKRCSAKRIDGHRCANWTNGTVDYGDFCRMHLTNRPHGEEEAAGHLAKARNRLQTAATAAVDELESLMATATSEPVRLGAAKEILDRAGIRGGIEVDQQVIVMQPAAETIRERLDRLRAGAVAKQELEARMLGAGAVEEVVDAEVIEEKAK